MKSLRPRALSALVLSLVAVSVWNCSSDEPEPGAGVSDGGASSSSSSSSSGDRPVQDGAPDPVIDDGGSSGLADSSADAATEDLSTEAILAAYIAMTNAKNLRCVPNSVPLSEEDPATVAALGSLVDVAGTTDELRRTLLACIEATAEAPCQGTPAACFPLAEVRGTLPNGSGCGAGAQCASGVCDGKTDSACGTCVAGLAVGADCAAAPQGCAPGLACDDSGTNHHCAVRSLVQAGAQCDSVKNLCGEGLQCVSTGPNERTCLVEAATGSICRTATYAVACANAANEYCSQTTSQCVPNATVSQSCDWSGEVGCRPGLICDRVDETCRAPVAGVALDAACTVGDTCANGATCARYDGEVSSQVCTARAALDAPCGYNLADCAIGLSCTLGVCKAPLTCPVP